MAFASSVAWEVRSTGSDTNGGGFDAVSGVPGTDRSQQDAAQTTYTDLVIDGTTNTKCTSAAFPFAAADVGNIINITSGTGFTVQRVQILSVSGVTATCDKSLGTLGSTGGNGKLGGGLATLAAAFTLVVAQNSVYVKAATYSQTAALAAPTVQFYLVGYNTSHTDLTGTVLITMATTVNANLINAGSGTAMVCTNIQFQFTGATANANRLVNANSGTSYGYFFSCYFDAGNVAGANTRTGGVVDGGGNWLALVFDNCKFDRFHANSAGQDGACIYSGQAYVSNCYFKDMYFAVESRNDTTGRQRYTITNCIFDTGLQYALYDTHDPGSPRYCAAWEIRGCSFTGSSMTAFRTLSSFTDTDTAATGSTTSYLVWENNIVYGCLRALDMNANSGTAHQRAVLNRDNAYGNNSNGNNKWTADASDITLTASPWTNTATPDFSLNSTVGGGAACRSAGFPGVLKAGGTGYADVGALRHQDPAGGTTNISQQNITRFVSEGEYA
jgi:hypothetical protein